MLRGHALPSVETAALDEEDAFGQIKKNAQKQLGQTNVYVPCARLPGPLEHIILACDA